MFLPAVVFAIVAGEVIGELVASAISLSDSSS